MEIDSLLPKGWSEEFHEKADFLLSFKRLEGCEHFYAEALRGRIRSLELEFDAAREHLVDAQILTLLVQADEDDEDAYTEGLAMFMVAIHCYENSLLEGLDQDGEGLSGLGVPRDLPDGFFLRFPQMRDVLSISKHAEAVLRIHSGDDDVALPILDELLKDGSRRSSAQSAQYQATLAAALHNLGDTGGAKKSLEAAGVAALDIDSTLERGLMASQLIASWYVLSNDEEAKNWREVLEELPCPARTRACLRQRAIWIFTRCECKKRMLPY